jgi:two-component system sensor histidine kinase YesM
MPYFYVEIMADLKNFNSARFYTDPVLQFDTVNNYTTTLKKLLNVCRDNVTQVVFFPASNVRDEAFLLNRTGGLETVNGSLESQPWYQAAASMKGNVYIIANEDYDYFQRPTGSLFSVIRIVKDVDSRQDIGALKVDASSINISEIFRNISVSENSFFLLLDNNNNVIYASKPPPDGLVANGGLIANLPENGARFSLDGDTFLTYSGSIGKTDWQLVYLSSNNDIIEKTRPVIYFTVAMGVLFMLLSIFIFALRSARPLLEQREKEHRLEIDQKTAEYMALQAQINPHFLNNTLNGGGARHHILRIKKTPQQEQIPFGIGAQIQTVAA